ncbi:MAG: hypothetical protein KAY22_12285, partial [Rhizorhabdus sp.]|uniref:hypothetical protein n=1 Tax=Rhizorhabdus sp. TaxID=1968843 RepID=UPI001B46D179
CCFVDRIGLSAPRRQSDPVNKATALLLTAWRASLESFSELPGDPTSQVLRKDQIPFRQELFSYRPGMQEPRR